MQRFCINIILPSLALLCSWLSVLAAGTTVSYDSSAIIINGERRVILSGSIHYPRSTPEVGLEYVPLCSYVLFRTRLRYGPSSL